MATDVTAFLRGEHIYDGIRYFEVLPQELLKKTENEFEFRKDDVIIVTYPKSGTTWVQQIAFLLGGKLKMEEGRNISINALVPFIEAYYSKEKKPYMDILESSESPRFMKTHLMPKFFKRALDVGAKIIFTYRNPKDTLVSYHNFYYMCAEDFDLSWDQFYQRFCEKALVYGDWFDFTLAWWECRHHKNFFIQSYEDMKADLPNAIATLAKFLNISLTKEKMNLILDHASFETMKNNPSVNRQQIDRKVKGENIQFMRKGAVGDWKNHFTVAQNEHFDKLYSMKMKDCGLKMQFET